MFPRLLICEGPEDRFFFHALIEAHALPRFHIQHAGGNSKFFNAISKFELENTRAYAGLQTFLLLLTTTMPLLTGLLTYAITSTGSLALALPLTRRLNPRNASRAAQF
jgi:hypothetical protein